MSDTKFSIRYCQHCRKEVNYFADKCPHCTADISKDNYDSEIISGAVGLFSSRKNFKNHFLKPFLILIIIGGGIFFLASLLWGKETAGLLSILVIVIFGFYKMITST